MDVRYCIGCFDCWVKTPGECVAKDETRDIRRAAIRKLFAALTQLGKTYGETGQYDQVLIQKLAKPEKLSKLAARFWQWMYKTSFGTSYFDEQLKKNGAYEQRFARPYEE